MSSYAMIIRAIDDAMSLSMFEMISKGGCTNQNQLILSDLKLTKKQYYSRLVKLQNAGLIKREKGTFSTTLFGIIVYKALRIIEDASANRWKVDAVEQISNNGITTKEETRQAIELLVTNNGIKQVLLGEVDKACQNPV